MAHLTPERCVLGVPGPSKKELAESHLSQVWERAFDELQHADVVVFVGYRFPESDGLARHNILEALRKNLKGGVRIVLGPHNRDTPRVKAMIDWTITDGRTVQVEELWGQDFFAAFNRDGL